MEQYIQHDVLLGTGTFGDVKLVTLKETGEKVQKFDFETSATG